MQAGGRVIGYLFETDAAGAGSAVLDLDGFYQPLWSQIQRGIDTGFIKPEYLDLWYPAPDVDALLRYLEGYAPHGYGAKWP